MKIVVFGATGLTGGEVLKQALEAGHSVTAVARSPEAITTKHERLTVVKGDAQNAGEVSAAVAGQDAVVVALGSRNLKPTTLYSDAARNVTAAMKQHGVKRLTWLSAAGVGDSADQTRRSSFIFGRIVMPLMLKNVYADHARAIDVLKQSGVEFVVARPVQLKNSPAVGKIIVTPPTEKIPHLTITRADVAKFLLEQLSSNAHVGQGPVISN
ncbi:MAG: NAD(P)-dependent oxidoreductase [Myxococcaceae bacterium]